MQTPRTTPAGRVHGALGFAVSEAPTKQTPAFAPDMWLGLGVHDRVELSLRFRPVAIEFGGKVQLVRDVVEVSLAPAVIAADEDALFEEAPDASTDVSVLAGRVTLYVGSDVDEPVSAWIAPTLDAGVREHPSSEHPGSIRQPFVAPGLLAGVVFAPGHSTRLFIEGGVLMPRAGDIYALERESAPARLGPGDMRLELNIGLHFGSYD